MLQTDETDASVLPFQANPPRASLLTRGMIALLVCAGVVAVGTAVSAWLGPVGGPGGSRSRWGNGPSSCWPPAWG